MLRKKVVPINVVLLLGRGGQMPGQEIVILVRIHSLNILLLGFVQRERTVQQTLDPAKVLVLALKI